MLDHKGGGSLPRDHRYNSFVSAVCLSEEIMRKLTLERHLTNIASIGKPTVFSKIWKEINAASMKKCGLPFEEVYCP